MKTGNEELLYVKEKAQSSLVGNKQLSGQYLFSLQHVGLIHLLEIIPTFFSEKMVTLHSTDSVSVAV